MYPFDKLIFSLIGGDWNKKEKIFRIHRMAGHYFK